MRDKLNFLLLIFFAFQVYGQNFDSIIEESICLTNKEAYYYDLTYKVFKGADGQKVYENYVGTIAFQDGKFYQKIDKMESLQTPNFSVKLNYSDKEIRINREDSFSPISMINLDLSNIYSLYDKGVFKENNNAYVLELIPKKNTVSQFSKVLIHICKKSKEMIKQVMFLNQKRDFSYGKPTSSKADFDIARLEITFVTINSASVNKDILFDESRYFTLHNNKIKLGEEFKNFELVPSY